MSHPDLHQDDVGTVVRRTIVDRAGVPVNLSAASVLEYRVEKPGQIRAVWPAVVNPADPTQMDYQLKSGDVDFRGVLRLQPRVKLSAAVDLVGDVETLEVGERLKAP